MNTSWIAYKSRVLHEYYKARLNDVFGVGINTHNKP